MAEAGFFIAGQVGPVGVLGSALAFALDHLPTPVLLTRDDGGLIHANRAARDWLSRAGAPLRLRSGRVGAADARMTSALVAALRRAKDATDGRITPANILRIPVPGNEMGVALMAVAAPESPFVSDGPPILLFLADHGLRLRTDAALLVGEFGLTRAEAEIAAALAGGESPETIAECRDASAATVRSQTKTIYAKLCVRTQSQLTSLLARCLAALRPPASD